MISVVVPVYNRPREAEELLDSLARQSRGGFEVVLVEDGSQVDSRAVAERYAGRLDVSYYVKENGGPGPARNYGAERAKGDFLVFLDSDCIAPPSYMEAVSRAVEAGVRAFGGPDRADERFTPMQKAVSYSMTSFFTTGGIRGGKHKLDRFIPRSFNMGVARDLFERVGGFAPMRFGEDIDLSMRIIAAGGEPRLLPEAAVCHKRRTSLRSFFRQVYFSGVARINLTKRHPGSLKAVHLLPAAFTVGSLLCLGLAFVRPAFLLPLGLAALVWCADSSLRNRSLRVGLLSAATSFVQLWGYGIGFLTGAWKRLVLKRTEAETYRTNFF